MASESACAQSENEYLETERDFRRYWTDRKASGNIDLQQSDFTRIPSWLNAPAWATWVYFCKRDGWLFTERHPETYGGGIVNRASGKSVRAGDVPGVLFFVNAPNKLGGEAPFWVQDRRKRNGE